MGPEARNQYYLRLQTKNFEPSIKTFSDFIIEKCLMVRTTKTFIDRSSDSTFHLTVYVICWHQPKPLK